MRTYIHAAAVLGSLLIPFAATAHDGAQRSASPFISISAGAAYAPDHEGSDDYRLLPLLQARVDNLAGKNTFISLGAAELTSNFIADSPWRAGIVARYTPAYSDEGWLEIDDMRVASLQDNASATDIGVIAGYSYINASHWIKLIEIAGLRDIAGSSGVSVIPRIQPSGPLSQRVRFVAGLSTTWWGDDDYMNNRFGISSADSVRSGLDAYSPSSGIKNVAADIAAIWILSQEVSITAFGAVNKLRGDAAKSPIVTFQGDDTNWMIGSVVTHRV